MVHLVPCCGGPGGRWDENDELYGRSMRESGWDRTIWAGECEVGRQRHGWLISRSRGRLDRAISASQDASSPCVDMRTQCVGL